MDARQFDKFVVIYPPPQQHTEHGQQPNNNVCGHFVVDTPFPVAGNYWSIFSIILHFFRMSYKWLQAPPFGAWFHSLRKMHLRFIHVVTWINRRRAEATWWMYVSLYKKQKHKLHLKVIFFISINNDCEAMLLNVTSIS